MTRKIFLSIMAASVIALIASIIIIMGCMYDYFGGVRERQLNGELTLAAAGVEKDGYEYLEALPKGDFRLTWVSKDGSVLYDTQADGQALENHAERKEIHDALISGEGKSTRYSATMLEKTVYNAKRLSDGTVLRISVRGVTMGTLVIGMLQPIFIVAAIVLILSFFLAKRISSKIVEPLNGLDLENPLENDTYDEIAPLLTRISRQQNKIDSQLAELQRKKDEFVQITESMSEGLVLLDNKGVILSINRAARELFSADESAVGRDFLTVERNSELDKAFSSAINSASGSAEASLTYGNREYRASISRIESDGAVVGAVLLTFDVTEKAQAERIRREFTANVSHELKTPLTSIIGSADLIENGLVKPEDMPRFVGHIHTEASRLLSLVEDIIRLSQLDEGVSLPDETVDLGEIAAETVSELREKAEEKNVTLSLDIDGDATLKGVPRLAQEIVYNLTDNAIKYNVEGGKVTVAVKKTDGGTVLTVSDTGIGIPPEHTDRVFERFYRVDKSHSKAVGGTGLGLSIVKHAAACFGASVDLRSEVGKGTEITVKFPAVKG